MRLLLPFLLAALLGAAELPKILYTKSFPGSVPAFTSISIDRQGRCEYKEAADDENPLVVKLSPADTDAIFTLAEKLGYFARPLESGLKVAMTGIKTFRYRNGPQSHEVKFNYSQDPDAQALLEWFERIAETEQRFIALERAAKYDKLGVNQELLYLQISCDRKRLVAPEQFLPLLDRIAKNETYIHMARARAASIAESIRNPVPVSQ
jgi:hypothetical protein